MQRLASIASVLMRRLVPSLAQTVKQLGDWHVDDLTILEPIEEVALGAAFFDRYADKGGSMLGQKFTELAQFDQGRIRVIKDITFVEGSMADQYLIVLYEEREVG
jgi:hypothetical protein